MDDATELCARVPAPLDPGSWTAADQPPSSVWTSNCSTVAWGYWVLDASPVDGLELDLGQAGLWEFEFPLVTMEIISPTGKTLSEGDPIEIWLESHHPDVDLDLVEFAGRGGDEAGLHTGCAHLSFDGSTVRGVGLGESNWEGTCRVGFSIWSDLDTSGCDVKYCGVSQTFGWGREYRVVE